MFGKKSGIQPNSCFRIATRPSLLQCDGQRVESGAGFRGLDVVIYYWFLVVCSKSWEILCCLFVRLTLCCDESSAWSAGALKRFKNIFVQHYSWCCFLGCDDQDLDSGLHNSSSRASKRAAASFIRLWQYRRTI